MVDAVLDVSGAVRGAEEAFAVRLVLGEEEGRRSLRAQVAMLSGLLRDGEPGLRLPDDGTLAAVPAPCVPEPEGREEVQRGGIRSAVVDFDPDVEILDPVLRILDEDVEVAIACEDASVDELDLAIAAPAAGVLFQQTRVGKLRLRIFVEKLHVRMRRGGVEVVVKLLHVLAVVSLRSGQAEKALFQDRVLAVPERKREAEHLAAIADAGDSVLVPAVGARAGVVVREVVPGVAVLAVVLANGAPRALGEVRSPALPVPAVLPRLYQPLLFSRHIRPV